MALDLTVSVLDLWRQNGLYTYEAQVGEADGVEGTQPLLRRRLRLAAAHRAWGSVALSLQKQRCRTS